MPKKQETLIRQIYGGKDPRDIPTYTVGEAAAYTGVPVATVRSWVVGRNVPARDGKKSVPPIITRPVTDSKLLSFTNLVEIHVLSALRKSERLQMKDIRGALEYVETALRKPHPLARQEFATDGVSLFIEHFGHLINASKKGQIALREIFADRLRRIERDELGLARTLALVTRPIRDDDRLSDLPDVVVVNPFVSFGKPVIRDTGIPIAVLAERYFAGESVKELSDDYEIPTETIDEAIRFQYRAA
jgi:uncharacterized protein (DUF433 family)